jgi:hypothetical protein
MRPVQTRFRCGYASERLNLALQINSLAHYAKGTLSPGTLSEENAPWLEPLVGNWFQVLVSLP